MKKTKFFLKSVLDGLTTYSLFYLFTSLFIFAGFKLLDIWPITYFQCFGAVLVIRQIVGLIRMATDKHVKAPPEEKESEFCECVGKREIATYSDGVKHCRYCNKDLQKEICEHPGCKSEATCEEFCGAHCNCPS